jgi:hypothetical protein
MWLNKFLKSLLLTDEQKESFVLGWSIAAEISCCSGMYSCPTCGDYWCCQGRSCDCDAKSRMGLTPKARQRIIHEASQP